MAHYVSVLWREFNQISCYANKARLLRNLLHLFGVDLGRIANGTVFHLIYEDGCWRLEAID